MLEKIKNLKTRQIISVTAISLIMIFLLNGIYNFISETVSRKNGTLEEKVLTVEDFTQYSMKQTEDGKLVSTDNDPQFINENIGKITSVKFYMETSMFPGEITLYYTEDGDSAFSERKRVWATPVQGEENWYFIDLRMKSVKSIRIDPTMYGGNIMSFGDFIFNQQTDFMNYFSISYGTVFDFIVYTGLISSIVKFIVEILNKKID